MYKNIINNLSDSALFELLDEEQQKKYQQLRFEQKEQFDLKNLVGQNLGIKLLIDKKLRKDIISSLEINLVKKMLTILEVDIKNFPTEKLYTTLIYLSNENGSSFASMLGFDESYKLYNQKSSEIASIEKITPVYPLYEYQTDCAKKVINYFNSGNRRVLLHLPTGAGKTRTCMNIICSFLRRHPKKLVVWMADRKELCYQASTEFKSAWNFLGNRELKSYSFYDDSQLSLSGIDEGFLVASVQKLNSFKKNISKNSEYVFTLLKNNTELLIFDEAHKIVAGGNRSLVLDFLHETFDEKTKLMGLTATPGRVRGNKQPQIDENKRLSEFFDNVKVNMYIKGYLSPIDYLYSNGFLAKPEFLFLDYEDVDIETFNTKKSSNVELLNKLSFSDNRNKKLITTIFQELESTSTQIILFACTVEHAKELYFLLAGKGVSCRCVFSDTNTIDRKVVVEEYKLKKTRVLINYGVFTAGFDAPCTNVVIIARPTGSLVEFSQMAGRGMRGIKSGGNKTCKIYTVNDDIPEFRYVNEAFKYWDELWQNGSNEEIKSE